MKKVIVASLNRAKLQVAQKAFEAVFPDESFEFLPVDAPSLVPDQPMGEEAYIGARNRLYFIKENHKDADFWISQEGGLFEDKGRLSNRAWIFISDKSGFTAESSTSNFYLPKKISQYVKEGTELGFAIDKFFETKDSKHNSGFLGYLTDGVYGRVDFYLQPAVIALSEIKHKDWFQ
jgi:inosine/xanthosine triphosphatase